MKISLATHGGWSAALRTPALTLDTAELPPDKAAELSRLAAAAEAAPRDETESAAKESAPEAMTSEIALEHEGGTVSLCGSDVSESREFAELRDWIQAHARRGAAPHSAE